MVKMEYLLCTCGTITTTKIYKTISKETRESRKPKANKETNLKRSTLMERVRDKNEKGENSQEIRKNIYNYLPYIINT